MSETVGRRIGFGVTLGVDPTGAGASYTIIGAIIDGVEGPDAKKTVIDTTLLSDAYRTISVAQGEPGEVTFQIAYDPSDTTSTGTLAGLLTSGYSSVAATNPPKWQISYPASGGQGAAIEAATDSFYGFVTGFKRTISKDKMITADITISISGNPGITGA